MAQDFASTSDLGVYDIFLNTSRNLGGMLVHLEDLAEAAGDTDAQARWRARATAVWRERETIRDTGRDVQIAALTAWRIEIDELRQLRREIEQVQPEP